MPLLLVKENPNKLLKSALKTRKACLDGKKLSMFIPDGSTKVININNKDGSNSDVTNPLDRFYMGLDQVAQFLNFCVMLYQLPTNKDKKIKDVSEIGTLAFDKSVLKELVNQYNQEKTSVEKLIGEQNMTKYTEQLKDLRSKYNNYCRAMINKDSGSYDQCSSFTKWISQSNNFVEDLFRAWDNGPWIGVDKITGEVVISKNIDRQSVKLGYHEGGGIKDKNELTKLLKLDAVLRCEKAIDKFIDSKALDGSTLSWFQNLWNNLVTGTWIANKLGWFFEEKEVKVKLKSNEILSNMMDMTTGDKKEKHGDCDER